MFPIRKCFRIEVLAVLSVIFVVILQCSAAVFSYMSLTATVTITAKPVYYLHRIDVSSVTPAGKLMNTTRPPDNQSETTYNIARGSSVYFYTPTLSVGSIESGNWTLYIWASTATLLQTSRLTVSIDLVYSNGTTKTSIGNADIVIDYGYSERIIIISGVAATITSGDRIRLTLYAQSDFLNDPLGVNFYYDGYGSYETLGHETRLYPP